MNTIHIPLKWSETIWDYMENHGRLEGDFLAKFDQVNAEVVGFYAIAHGCALVRELRNLVTL